MMSNKGIVYFIAFPKSYQIVCEIISSLSQLLMKIIMIKLVILRRPFYILHDGDVE